MTRIVALGSTAWNRHELLTETLTRARRRLAMDELVTDARFGAGAMIEAWARSAAGEGVRLEILRLDTAKWGKTAAVRVNMDMVALAPAAVILFPGGKREFLLDDLAERARAAGLVVHEVGGRTYSVRGA